MRTRQTGRPGSATSGLRTAAVVVVGLALLAVAYLAWRGASGGATADPLATARPATSAQATTTVRQSSVDPVTGFRWIDEASLPAPARRVLAQIDKGGPFDYAKDGSIFMNAEGLLPRHPTGFYREYTVVLPGSEDRGPVRIVVGGKGELYLWTTDHYASFQRIRR